jgi:signal transduction histidine kinase
MTKLLDKPLKVFTMYALIVLLCSIPVYFVIIDFIWIHEIKERNEIVAASAKKNFAALKLDDSRIKSAITLWNNLQPETKIQEVNELKDDSTYNVYRKNNYVADERDERFQGLVTYFLINGKPYSMKTEANVEESYETIFAITAVTVMFFLILLAGFIKLNKRISQNLWKPFYRTLAQIKAFDLSNHENFVFESSKISEFEELNTSIKKLIDSNVMVFRQQKEFTENASHELQTPLAIVKSKLDLLLQDPSITPRQSLIIEETNHALLRVSRVNKNLLLLAKIESQQFLEKHEVNMAHLTQQLLDVLAGLFEEKTIAFEIRSECIVSGNIGLIEIMVTNLLMNALRYTDRASKIHVSLAANELIVSNSGNYGLDSEKMFKRFSSASIQTPGSGLGLSIVKEICNRYGWALRYDYIGLLHVFTIAFKVQDNRGKKVNGKIDGFV